MEGQVVIVVTRGGVTWVVEMGGDLLLMDCQNQYFLRTSVTKRMS